MCCLLTGYINKLGTCAYKQGALAPTECTAQTLALLLISPGPPSCFWVNTRPVGIGSRTSFTAAMDVGLQRKGLRTDDTDVGRAFDARCALR